MASQRHADIDSKSEAAILTRMIHPERADLPEAAAEAVLKLFGLDQGDADRFHDLLVRNQGDALTPPEKEELETYLRVSMMIDLMHAKARYSLKKHA
ncbi:hypothetical protein OJF2_39330 [Aquisphaera giovannonii]|uniref:Uncharacterized protein n=1 Tax=Aquisphaera giovannonii TaxID=406548 RepID=A0A5B9W5X9_9BACT|nr:hypothetical protein [Aquisphaera giovannonii]QEH35381.1 hypothetical protein OJF2_39330 [Aquisphaera giovannonii]